MAWVFLPLLRRFCHSFIANKTSIWLYCTSNTAYVLSDSELFNLSQAHGFTPCFCVVRVFIVLAFCVVLLCWVVFIFRSSQPVHDEGRKSYPRVIRIVWPISIYSVLFPLWYLQTFLRGYHTLQGDNFLKSAERFDHIMFVCRFQASRWSKSQREKLLCG
jgi:hypothetical protein